MNDKLKTRDTALPADVRAADVDDPEQDDAGTDALIDCGREDEDAERWDGQN